MARRGTKKFTTWEFKHELARIEIPVRVVDQAKDHRDGKGETFFRVTLDDPEINEDDTDINRLRETVFAKIKEKLKIEWRTMLVLEIGSTRGRLFDKRKKASTPDTYGAGTGQLELKWKRVQIATVNGEKISRTFNNYYQPSNRKEPGRESWNNATKGWPDTPDESGRWSSRDESVKAMIPDTPENRVALEAIADNLEKLYLALKKLLGSDRIEQTLATVAAQGLLALPAPK